MVAASDLQRASQLQQELRSLERVATGLDGDWRINAMTLGPPGETMLRPQGTTIATADWSYPPTMTDTIKGLLQTRRQAIEAELQNLGVTGVGS